MSDTVASRILRLAEMEISPGEEERASFQGWLASLPEEEHLAFLHDVSDFAERLEIPLEGASNTSADPVHQARQDGLYHYILAMWRLYQLISLGAIQGAADKQ